MLEYSLNYIYIYTPFVNGSSSTAIFNDQRVNLQNSSGNTVIQTNHRLAVCSMFILRGKLSLLANGVGG